MGRRFLVSLAHTSRSIFHLRWRLISHLRWRLILILLISAFFEQQHLYLVHRQSLASKYSATEFDAATEQLLSALSTRSDEDDYFREEIMVNHDNWRFLGRGWEGTVFTYGGWVIKTFTTGRSPFRNHVPGTRDEKWPTEIAASMRFGGVLRYHNDSRVESDNKVTLNGFLPCRAFKAALTRSSVADWYLVTPLLTEGNLMTFAGSLALLAKPRTFREIDADYRPAFDRLLESLQYLHEAGYCHDDIKPVNIFVDEDTHWVFGDLGNLRQIEHSYHSSRLWKDNGQLEDCRANDAMRALKSYMKFVQTSSRDRVHFNEEFVRMREPLSRLFWRASANAPKMSASQVRQWSLAEGPRQPAVLDSPEDGEILQCPRLGSLLGMFSRELEVQHLVNNALQTRMGEKMARWWAMTWVFGVPVAD